MMLRDPRNPDSAWQPVSLMPPRISIPGSIRKTEVVMIQKRSQLATTTRLQLQWTTRRYRAARA
jgi:hypothetical protein